MSTRFWGLAAARCLLAACSLAALSGPVFAVTIHFDTLAAGAQPGNALAAQGVTFTTGNIPNAVTLGGTVTLASPDPQFDVFAQPANAVSPPNFVTAHLAGLNDLLIGFSAPVTEVSLRTDHFFPEPAEVVRLLALRPTANPNEFQVIGIAEGFDNATSAPADTLVVNLGGVPFRYALFQTTTEPEGFDDLSFTPALPAPALGGRAILLLASLLLWAGLHGIGRIRAARFVNSPPRAP